MDCAGTVHAPTAPLRQNRRGSRPKTSCEEGAEALAQAELFEDGEWGELTARGGGFESGAAFDIAKLGRSESCLLMPHETGLLGNCSPKRAKLSAPR